MEKNLRVSPTDPSQSGQAAIEYILLLVVIAGLALLLAKGLQKSGISAKYSATLKNRYARVYRYGHPQAMGLPEEAPYNAEGPKMHPRIDIEGSQNFRIFILSEPG